MEMYDQYGRHIHYLRISLTDACNLRCVYCMPEQACFRPRRALLQDDEILMLVQAAVELGVDRIRLTGGEPTIRANIVDLVRRIAQTPGVRDLSMTTNGVLLKELAAPLAEAGLSRVNISLDTLNPEKFHWITRGGHLEDVWAGIEAAEAAGLTPIKLNCVVTRGYNDEEVVDIARLTLDHPWDVRFIELMPLGSVAHFQREALVPTQETMERIVAELGPLQEVSGDNGAGPSRDYRLSGARGTLGFISSVTAPFCAECTRIRVTADGKLRLCLLRDVEIDLLTPMREGIRFEALKELIRRAVWHKPWGHGLPEGMAPKERAMSQIGG